MNPSLLLVLGLLSALTPFAIDMYLPSIPSIAQDLDSSIELAQISVTVYLGVFAASQLVLGPLSDVLGRRRVIGGGLGVFVIGSLGCGMAADMSWLLAARAVQALGGAAIAVTVPALVRDLFEKDDYARVMTMVMLVMALAPLLAPSVGGLIIVYASWRWVFVALLAIALIAVIAFYHLVDETLSRTRRQPFAFAPIMANYAILLRHRVALGYLLTGAASFGGMMTFIVTSPYVYIELRGVPEAWFGPLFGINVALAMAFAALNARLVPRLGAERLLRFGLTVQVLAATLLLLLALLPSPELVWIAVAAGLYMAVIGMVLGNSMAGFMSFFPSMAGTASALSGAARFGFGSLVGSVVSLLHDDSARPLLLGMALCGLVAAGVYRSLCCTDADVGDLSSPPRPQ